MNAKEASAPDQDGAATARASRRHFAIGWWGLFVAMVGGLVVDALLGLKLGVYLDASNQTRRLMWRLAHAHAAGLSLVHLGLGAYFASVAVRWTTRLRLASSLSVVGLLAMPTGFALGGVQLYGDDPGLGVFLVPVGGIAVTLAIGCMAIDSVASSSSPKASSVPPAQPLSDDATHGVSRRLSKETRR